MCVTEGRRRNTVDDQMSASESSREKLAGLTLDDVLANQKRLGGTLPSQPPHKSRTLLEIIKEDESTKKDRRSWKAFKDKLRLKRAGSAWTSSIHIPTSDVPMSNPNTRNNFANLGRRNSVRFQDSDMSTQYNAHQVEDLDPTEDSDSPASVQAPRHQFSRKGSTRYAADSSDNNNNNAGGNLRPQLSRRNSTNVQTEPFRRGRVVTFRDNMDGDEDDDYDRHLETGRALSAREAVAAQEAAEAAAAAEAEEEAGRGQVTMSLMDLLEETDREMGLEGARYILSDEDEEDDDEEDEVDEGEDAGGGGGALEHSCCICMVRHKGAAIIPCGHTFCRMCSRELMVSKGNCPICNNFILEILDIF